MPTFDAEGSICYYDEDCADDVPAISDLILWVGIRLLKHELNRLEECPFYFQKYGGKCLNTEIKNMIDSAPKELNNLSNRHKDNIRKLWPTELLAHITSMCGDGGSCDNMPKKRGSRPTGTPKKKGKENKL